MSLVRVLFPYQGQDHHQLTLHEGDVITVVQRQAGGWWIGRNESGEIGIFPSSYTTEVKEKPRFNVPKEAKTKLLSQSTTSSAMNQSSKTEDLNFSNRQDKLRQELGLDDEDDFFAKAHALSPNAQRIVALRNEVRSLDADIQKMKRQKKTLEAKHSEEQRQVQTIDREVHAITAEIHERNQRVQRLEKTIEVLKAAMDKIAIPPFSSDELWPIMPNGRPAPASKSASQQPLSPPPAQQPPPQAAPQASPGQGFDDGDDNEDDAEVEDEIPFDPNTCEDPIAKKLIKKLSKRIAEAEATKQEYSRQERKLKKRIQKHKDALIEHEAANGSASNGSGKSAIAEELQVIKQQIRVAEEKKAKYQQELVSAGLQEEEEKLAAVVQKLTKRYAKGTTANEELRAKLATAKAETENAVAIRQQLESQIAAAKQEERAASEDLKKATEEEAQALQAIKQEEEILHQKIKREQERVASFRKQLAELQAAQAQQ